MKRAFVKYLFPLCFLLLGGIINLYADKQDLSVTENANYLQNSENPDSSALIEVLQHGLEKRHCAEIEIEELKEGEEEIAEHSFSFDFGSFLTANSFVASWGQLFLESNTNSGLSQPKSTSSTRKHIMFQVFRI
nr:hypothetical protein [Muricauda sp. UBA7809]|tara:strand:- start:12660 stop:13061 length:402 start_codon:yes stop_codon:yes gene_type:complete